jgi:hypothetical protein
VKNNVTFKYIAVSALLALTTILLSPLSVSVVHSEAQATEEGEPVFEIEQQQHVLLIGEELVYNVSYSFFDLGSVKFKVLDTLTRDDKIVYKVNAFVDSYSGVPFVNLHEVFYSEMTSYPYSTFFSIHNTANPEEMPFTKYHFDYKNNKVTFEHGTAPKNIISKKGEGVVRMPQQDGLSLFYYARAHCQEKKRDSVQIFTDEKSFYTKFNFMNKIGSEEIDAITYPVEVNEFDGNAEFTGIFGLTGYFHGYFSNDEASIPIVAKMKVILGSVHIELIKWNRPGWVPPKAS